MQYKCSRKVYPECSEQGRSYGGGNGKGPPVSIFVQYFPTQL